jgi:hypothetical protein
MLVRCRGCGTTYRDGEKHKCPRNPSTLERFGLMLFGLIAGAFGGYLLVTLIACSYGGNQCGVLGMFFGAPLGAFVGLLMGARW